MDEETKKTPSVAGRIFKWLAVLFVLALIGLAVFRVVESRLQPAEEVAEKVINVKVATAGRIDLNTSSIITGRLEAVDEASVLPKVPGQVTRVNVEMGQEVSKGQVLFTMDSKQVRDSIDRAELSLSDAKTALDRMSLLYSEGAVSTQQYEQAQSAYDMASQAYSSASSALGDYTVTAPISGYVTSVNVSDGSMASQAMAAVTISNIDSLVVNAGLSENIINKIKLGDTVDVKIKSASQETFKGSVAAIAPAPVSGTLTYPVKITLGNGDASLKPGMSVEIAIESESAEAVLAVPTKAVIVRGGRQVVATLGINDEVTINDVSTGMDNGEFVEITEGVSEGDRVVVEGQSYVDVTSKVNVVP